MRTGGQRSLSLYEYRIGGGAVRTATIPLPSRSALSLWAPKFTEARGPIGACVLYEAGIAAHRNDIRVIEIEGNPWFSATDVLSVLGLVRGGRALAALDEDQQQVVRKCDRITFKGHGLKLISESGLHRLIMRSDKPDARPFQDWVTRVVLPAIRNRSAHGTARHRTTKSKLLKRRRPVRAGSYLICRRVTADAQAFRRGQDSDIRRSQAAVRSFRESRTQAPYQRCQDGVT